MTNLLMNFHRELRTLVQADQEATAIDLVEQCYSRDPDLRDGFAVIGNIYREAKDWNKAQAIMHRDWDSGRMSWSWQLRFAEVLMELGYEDTARQLVEGVYVEQPQAKDGYARLGWVKARVEDWQAAFALMEEDSMAGRLSSTWKVHFAQVVARCGDESRSVELIQQAYAADDTITDGFARLGWIYHDEGDWEAAYAWMERDASAERMSPAWQVNFAQVVARRGDESRSVELIQQAYAADDTIADGFARLGWIQHDAGDWEAAYAWMERDASAERMSPAWQVNFAQVVAQSGDIVSAVDLIRKAYISDTDLQDGFSRLGWIYWQEHQWTDAFNLMDQDFQHERMSFAWKVNYAKVLTALKRYEDAYALCMKVLEQGAEAAGPELYAQLARLCQWTNRLEIAETLLLTALRNYPDYEPLTVELAYLAIAKNDLHLAKTRLKVFLSANQCIDGEASYLLQQVLLSQSWLSRDETIPGGTTKVKGSRNNLANLPIILVTDRDINFSKSPCGTLYNVFVNPKTKAADYHSHVNIAKETGVDRLEALQERNFVVIINSISCFSQKNLFYFLSALPKKRCTIFMYWHETAWTIRLFLQVHYEAMSRIIKLFASFNCYHLVVSSQSMHCLVALFGIPFETINIVHEVPDLSTYSLKSQEQQESSRPIVIGAGRGYLRKGLDLFSVIAHIVRSTLNPKPEFRWYLFEESVQPTIVVPYPEDIVVMDYVQAFDVELKKADCLLLTSRDDPAARVVFEALAVGIPALSFESTGFSELIPEIVCSNYREMVDKTKIILSGNIEEPSYYRSLAEQFNPLNWLRLAFANDKGPICSVPTLSNLDLGLVNYDLQGIARP